MTQKEKACHWIGIAFLALAVFCAVLYAVFAVMYAGVELPQGMPEDILAQAGDILRAYGLAYLTVCGSLVVCLLGAVASLGTALLTATRPLKIAGYCGIALHLVLLALFWVQYGEIMRVLFLIG